MQSLEEIKEKNEQQLNDHKDSINKLERESGKFQKKVKELEEILADTENSKMELERQYEQLMINYNRTRSRAEKLTEDIQLIEKAKPTEAPKKPKVRRHISLMSELEEIDRELTQSPSTPSTPTNAFTLSSRMKPDLAVQANVSSIHVTAKKTRELNRRKDPLEEYFTLVTNI